MESFAFPDKAERVELIVGLSISNIANYNYSLKTHQKIFKTGAIFCQKVLYLLSCFIKLHS